MQFSVSASTASPSPPAGSEHWNVKLIFGPKQIFPLRALSRAGDFTFLPKKNAHNVHKKRQKRINFFFAIIQPCVRPPSEQEGELLCSLFLFHVLPFIIMEYKKISERLQSDQNVSWWFFPFHFSDGYHFYICGMRVVHGETTENNKMRGREKQATDQRWWKINPIRVEFLYGVDIIKEWRGRRRNEIAFCAFHPARRRMVIK